jgi:hypothetical protein
MGGTQSLAQSGIRPSRPRPADGPLEHVPFSKRALRVHVGGFVSVVSGMVEGFPLL